MTDQKTEKAVLRPASSFPSVWGAEEFWRAYQRAKTQQELLGLLFGRYVNMPSCLDEEILDCYLLYADHRAQNHNPYEGGSAFSYELCEQAYLCLCHDIVRGVAGAIHVGIPFFHYSGHQAFYKKLLEFFSDTRNFSSQEPCKRDVAGYLQRFYNMLMPQPVEAGKRDGESTAQMRVSLRGQTVEALAAGGWVNRDLWKFLVERKVTEALPFLSKQILNPTLHHPTALDIYDILYGLIRHGGVERDLALTILDLREIETKFGPREF